jgi:hypothetical protein
MSARDRALLLEWLRSEVVGPCLPEHHPQHRVVPIVNDGIDLTEQESHSDFRPVFYRPADDQPLEEIVCFPQETPKGKYGVGLLYPEQTRQEELTDGVDEEEEAGSAEGEDGAEGSPPEEDTEEEDDELVGGAGDDLDLSVQDRFRQGTMGVSFFAKLAADGAVVIRFPRQRRFTWQEEDRAFPVNGWYRPLRRRVSGATEADRPREFDAWARCPAMPPAAEVRVPVAELRERRVVRRDVAVAEGCPLRLRLELYPRKDEAPGRSDHWLFTVVLRNVTPEDEQTSVTSRILFQSYFEVAVENGVFRPYPESRLVSEMQDEDERSLALLYADFATWGTGHGCAAGWDSEPGQVPALLHADVMPAVETPSMTPEIEDAAGKKVSVAMRQLMDLPPWQRLTGTGWDALEAIVEGYRGWLEKVSGEAAQLPAHHRDTADRHILACRKIQERMAEGLKLLKRDSQALRAFRLANQAMLLQQIATKVIARRPLFYDDQAGEVRPRGSPDSPAQHLATGNYDQSRIGIWRAFQIAFLLMSLPGCAEEQCQDREIVDLIWFPTGGGKTEAYLGVAAFLMFHQRLLQSRAAAGELRRDGTNVLMRYTLRMLTTQQFQRAASLVCAMEYLRRDLAGKGDEALGEAPFTLGLWIGRDGAPNRLDDAKTRINWYRARDDRQKGNPLILTECPWCRSQIGRYVHNDEDTPPRGWKVSDWRQERLRGIVLVNGAWRLRCPDRSCPFNQTGNEIIPVQVIDEVLYQEPPSLLIGTADKFAMLAYRHEARGLFGLDTQGKKVVRRRCPPALIIQDELHLISGPLGTLFGLYEGVMEWLCSHQREERTVRPKIVCSTATIRGAREQVSARPDGGRAGHRPRSPGPGARDGADDPAAVSEANMSEQYDAIIIGSGQAGGPLAGAFAKAGRKTALV